MLGRGPVAVGLLLWSRSRQRRKLCFGVVERRRHAGGRVVRDRLGVGLGESDRVRVRGVRPRRLVLVLVVIGFVLAVLILLGRARVGRVDRLDSGLANLLQQLVGAFHDLRRRAAPLVTACVHERGVVLRERRVHLRHCVAERRRVARRRRRSLVVVVLFCVLVGRDLVRLVVR